MSVFLYIKLNVLVMGTKKLISRRMLCDCVVCIKGYARLSDVSGSTLSARTMPRPSKTQWSCET